MSIQNAAAPQQALTINGQAAMLATPEQLANNRRSLKPLALLRPYVLRYKRMALFAFLALIVSSGSTLVMPFAVREMIDEGFSSQKADLINIYFAGLFAVGAVLAAASSTRFYCVSWLGERVVADVRADVFRHLTTLSSSFYEKTHSGEIMSRLNTDTTQVKAAVSTSVSQFLRNSVMLVGAMALMAVTSVKLSLLVMIVIPLVIVPLILYGRTVRRYSRIAQDEIAASSSFASENLSAVRTMQAFTSEGLVANRFAASVSRAFDAAVSRTKRRAALTATGIFLVFGSITGVLWYGAHDVINGVTTGGTLAQFVLYAVFAAAAVGELSEVWGEMQAAAGATERLAEIMAVKPEIRSPLEPRPFPAHARGEVTFDDVTFSYPLRPAANALDHVSFIIRPGERVAIVGPSGGGKSTIFNLILRFYDARYGRVLVDRVPVNQADLHKLRERISIVSQDTTIFAESVADNIRYGRPKATLDEIKAASRAAMASTFIDQLPQGYDTMLGERGVVLSGGQKQRIAIARAILKDAPILLLDEATSALDQESEKLVQSALDRVMKGRTTLVIAHRLATVINADRILVIESGKLVEEGTHASLINAGGVYARLAGLQLTSQHEGIALAS